MDENKKMMIDKDEFFFTMARAISETAEKHYGDDIVAALDFIKKGIGKWRGCMGYACTL